MRWSPGLSGALAFAFSAVLVMGTAQELAAQGRGGGGPRRDRMEQRIQARFDNLVREELGLNDDEISGLQDVVQAFRARRTEFARREAAARAEVARLVRDDGAVSDQDASAILEEMRRLSSEEADLFQEEQGALLEILTPTQVVRFILLRQQLGDRIRNLRRGAAGPRRPPNGGRQGLRWPPPPNPGGAGTLTGAPGFF